MQQLISLCRHHQVAGLRVALDVILESPSLTLFLCTLLSQEGVQGPVSLADIAKSSGFDVALDVILGPPAPITGPLTGSSNESGAPVVFFGDYQVFLTFVF